MQRDASSGCLGSLAGCGIYLASLLVFGIVMMVMAVPTILANGQMMPVWLYAVLLAIFLCGHGVGSFFLGWFSQKIAGKLSMLSLFCVILCLGPLTNLSGQSERLAKRGKYDFTVPYWVDDLVFLACVLGAVLLARWGARLYTERELAANIQSAQRP